MREQAWRLNNLYWIINKAGKRVKFRMNWAQEELYERLWYNDLILKARQLGMSTIVQLIGLDNCVFNPNYSFGVIAHEMDAASDIYRRNIRYPYDNLPEAIRSSVAETHATQHFLKFTNNSSVRVGVSLRSGTYQMLHVSEFGKICAKYPLKAQEIVTGSFETVPQGGIKIVESTAEGRSGYFYEYCEGAKALRDAGRRLTRQDWRMFFFPWWRHPDYALPDTEAGLITIDDEYADYFSDLEAKIKRKLSKGQRAWYVAKLVQTHKRDWELMKREYPSTEEEAFEVSLEGSYYRKQISWLRQHKRICRFSIEPSASIMTGWDIGIDDFTAIWMLQRVGRENRLVGYHENQGEPLQYYVTYLRKWARDNNCVLGEFLMPHDARQRAKTDGTSYGDFALSLGCRPLTIVNTPDLLGGIQQTRGFLQTCWIHEENCAKGIVRLENYSKEEDTVNGGWKDKPKHDDNSNGADALRTLAQGLAHRHGDLMSLSAATDSNQYRAILPEPEPEY